jgi:hypothetical protein
MRRIRDASMRRDLDENDARNRGADRARRHHPGDKTRHLHEPSLDAAAARHNSASTEAERVVSAYDSSRRAA